ncbi:flagellar basal body-associated protein FliL [Aquibacillus sediminis]|uniref:flagellar basal body-associated protein FliL n=1 Tax=Aquibacillus sediminis TaxID=2574734 RepID=UPI001FECDAD6|nr:flagellar basal body-associated protein FliL [Aquibacillus sediminis]
MSPKLFKVMVSILVVLTIAGVVSLVLILNGSAKGNGELSLDKKVEYSFTTSEMNTDLKDGSFVRIQFQFMMDSKKAKEEIQKREFQIKNILIKQSVSMTEQDFRGGLTELEEKMKTEINKLMNDGKVEEVYIISKILQ